MTLVDAINSRLKDLSLHTITVLPLTIVYCMSEVHCTLNVLHSITP